jgi:hypothetical protein
VNKIDTESPTVRAVELVILLTHRLAFIIGDEDDDPTAVVSTRDLLEEAREFVRDYLN